MIGFEVGDVALEEMEALVQGISEPQALLQQVKDPQAGAVESFRLGGDVIVDVLGLEHGAALLVPLPFPQAALDATLAIPEPLLYPGFHLKYLPAWGGAIAVLRAFPQKCRGISSFFRIAGVRARGKRLFRA